MDGIGLKNFGTLCLHHSLKWRLVKVSFSKQLFQYSSTFSGSLICFLWLFPVSIVSRSMSRSRSSLPPPSTSMLFSFNKSFLEMKRGNSHIDRTNLILGSRYPIFKRPPLKRYLHRTKKQSFVENLKSILRGLRRVTHLVSVKAWRL